MKHMQKKYRDSTLEILLILYLKFCNTSTTFLGSNLNMIIIILDSK